MALVCWSGGVDSTLMLHDLLQEASPADPVHALSFTHSQVPAQREQKRAREKLKRRFQKRHLHFQHATVAVSQPPRDPFGAWHSGLVQPVLWVSLAVSFLRDKETLYLGYVKGDDFWSVRSLVERMFHRQCEIMCKECDLQYPLQIIPKSEVIARLRDEGLYDATWTCERPKNSRPCGHCPPCRHRWLAEQELKKFGRVGSSED